MDKISLPTTAVIHITENCTHKCAFCYAGKGLGLHKTADIKVLYLIIDKLDHAGIKTVCLLGGDPVKYPFIIELLKYIKNNSKIRASLMSNTFLPEKGTFDDLINYIDLAETTIHGIDSYSHDAFCGVNGAYDNLVEKLLLLSNRGVIIGLAINVIPANHDLIFDMVSNFNSKILNNLSHIVVQRIIPSGRAEKNKNYFLTKNQVNTAMEQIDKINRILKIDISIEDPFPLCIVEPNYHKYMHRCEWGISKFSLNAEGYLSRCGATPNQTIGNILDIDFYELWNNTNQLVEFREMRYLSDRCVQCDNKLICGGGCPISAKTNTLGVDYLADEVFS